MTPDTRGFWGICVRRLKRNGSRDIESILAISVTGYLFSYILINYLMKTRKTLITLCTVWV